MAWEENLCICLHMQLIAILSRIGVFFAFLGVLFYEKSIKVSFFRLSTEINN
jgi:hypothetical protein